MSTSSDTNNKSSASTIRSISAIAAPIVVVKPPPADANIPSVPEGTQPTNGTDYRGIVPKKAELAVLGDVVAELENNAEFSAHFGRTMPSVGYIVQVLTAANQWSLMRNKTDAWDLYARTQEGLTWMTARALMAKMKPVFEATAGANADVATQFPSLGLLLGAAKVIAKRGVTTRKGNAKNRAKGEAPAKGAVARQVRDAARVVANHAAPGPETGTGGGAAAGAAQGAAAGTEPAAGTVTASAAPGGASARSAPAATASGAPEGTVGAQA